MHASLTVLRFYPRALPQGVMNGLHECWYDGMEDAATHFSQGKGGHEAARAYTYGTSSVCTSDARAVRERLTWRSSSTQRGAQHLALGGSQAEPALAGAGALTRAPRRAGPWAGARAREPRARKGAGAVLLPPPRLWPPPPLGLV